MDEVRTLFLTKLVYGRLRVTHLPLERCCALICKHAISAVATGIVQCKLKKNCLPIPNGTGSGHVRRFDMQDLGRSIFNEVGWRWLVVGKFCPHCNFMKSCSWGKLPETVSFLALLFESSEKNNTEFSTDWFAKFVQMLFKSMAYNFKKYIEWEFSFNPGQIYQKSFYDELCSSIFE